MKKEEAKSPLHCGKSYASSRFNQGKAKVFKTSQDAAPPYTSLISSPVTIRFVYSTPATLAFWSIRPTPASGPLHMRFPQPIILFLQIAIWFSRLFHVLFLFYFSPQNLPSDMLSNLLYFVACLSPPSLECKCHTGRNVSLLFVSVFPSTEQ